MNKKNILRNISLLAISSLITLSGCKDENNVTPPSGELLLGSTRTLNESSLISGKIRVKFTREVGNNITTQVNGESISRCGVSNIDRCLEKVGAISMKRVFPYAGKFEERTRKEGLHLWYDIEFDKSTSVIKVANEFRQIEGVDIVEERYKVEAPTVKFVVANTPEQTADAYFDDPQLPAQWHYENKGTLSRSIAGADINLVNAWKIESGKSNVIVSVVDGGIDYDHEDIIDNIWINEAELNGTEGVDDDGNGMIDDIYGYNFVSDRGTITADDHGTHVAGTVAARNNNGIGVCGVAGGNGDKDSGVRLMSCQIFEGRGGGDHSAAIKYGADNGAVISQNSWGYEYPGPSSLPASDKAAIDYFIKHAGCDNDGNQLPDSPMKGGVVIFAAGNDDADFKAYPAAYSEVISVSAMAPDFKKAYYTNRGDWITLMAPGGDAYYPRGCEILSTLPNNKYGYFQGTSMACPHVSGVAALIVSKFGKQGFTNEDLKKRLKSSFRPYSIDEKNPGYKGRLGAGYIDAEKALAENKNMKPSNVTDAKVEASYDYVNVTFTAVEDTDDGTALFYLLYYSKDQLNASNYTSAKVAKIKGMAAKVGEKITYKLDNLDLNTDYNFALVAEDRWGLLSDKPYFFKAKTLENLAPKVSIVNERTIRVTETEKEVIEILVEEPEGQSWRYSLEGDKSGVTAKKTSKGITLTFSAKAPFGQYKVKVKVLDIFNSEGSVEIPFEVYKNNPPQVVKEFTKIFAPIGQDISLDLTQYFKEPDGHTIKYEISSDNRSTVNATLSETTLKITPSTLGSGIITINASDIHGAKTTVRFDVQVVKNELVYIAYPIPVESDFFVRLNDKITNSTVKILTTTGSVVYEKNYTTNTPEERLLKLDLSKVSGGTYVLSVEANGENYKKSFIKL